MTLTLHKTEVVRGIKVLTLVVALLMTGIAVAGSAVKHLAVEANANLVGSDFHWNGMGDEPEVNIYPNPTAGVTFIDVRLAQPTDVTIVIYNLLGTAVARMDEKDITGGKFKIDLSGQANGLYFAEVRTKDGVKMARIRVTR
ncbi:MAG: T9SS type A sorting domain-containing protein [Flavobacteriales bacterium]|nr:T9SS type A sorting domain-containing protein [Flavobacteriales bacterium]